MERWTEKSDLSLAAALMFVKSTSIVWEKCLSSILIRVLELHFEDHRRERPQKHDSTEDRRDQIIFL